MRWTWKSRFGKRVRTPGSEIASASAPHVRSAEISPELWENTLGSLVVGHNGDTPLAQQLAADPGLQVFRHLVSQFRASSVVGTLPFTGRLLLLSLGEETFQAILDAFWRAYPPEAFGAVEARRFAAFLKGRASRVPFLEEVMSFDLAAIAAITEGISATVFFSDDPRIVLGSLADRHLPRQSAPGKYCADITTDGIVFRSCPQE